MLENNIATGEEPERFVVYMGSRAVRDAAAYDRIRQILQELRSDQTLLIQSGKPVATIPTHERAPRVLMANGNVVGRWSNDEDYYNLEQAGLTYAPGMTAAAWQYIGSQGILQGTFQTFTQASELFFDGSMAGRVILTAGCGGMGGAQPMAGKMAGAIVLVIDVSEASIRRRVATGYCDHVASDVDEALAIVAQARTDKRALSIGLVGNVADIYPVLLEKNFLPDLITDQTLVDPRRGYVPQGMSVAEARHLATTDINDLVGRAKATLRVHAAAFLEFRRRGVRAFEYGNALRMRAADVGLSQMLTVDSFVTLFVRPLFCRGIGPFRWLALSGEQSDIETIDALAEEMFADIPSVQRWLALARRHVKPIGLPARVCWLGHGQRSRLADRVNQAVAQGELKAPVAFTRDHLDGGSVASPFRETEKMRDGSDAIADWPIINGLQACAAGADLVAIHGQGDRSQSAGNTCVADGTRRAHEKLAAVLNGDTGLAVIRHADAGYEDACRAKQEYLLGD